MNNFSLILILVTFFIISCQSDNHREILSDIDLCKTKIDSSISIMEKYNDKGFYDVYIEMDKNIKNYNKAINDSSQLKVILYDIGEYASLSKYFKKTGSKHKSLYTELVLSKNQIETLKIDIINNELSPEEIEKYYKKEIQIANILFAETVRMSNLAENNLLLFDSLNKVIINLQDSVK